MAGAITWKGTLLLIEQPESGRLSLADRVTMMRVYRGPKSVCDASALRRGTFGTGAMLGWVVTSSLVDGERKGIGKLTINWEVGGAFANSAFLPLDEFDCEPQELYPQVQRNPAFHALATWGGTIGTTNAADLWDLAYNSGHAATVQGRDSAYNRLADLAEHNPDSDPVAQALVLADIMRRGTETYYLAGQRYQWTWYSFTLPALSLGGVTSAPLGPMYGAFPAGSSALRLADAIQPAGVNGSVFKITSTWLVAPNGYWDPILYPVV